MQSYLDGAVDDVTSRRVTRHLEMCQRCGLEAATYREIKRALARGGGRPDPGALQRLKAFAEHLDDGGEPDVSGMSGA